MILGVSPYLTPWQLWARRVGLIPTKDEPDEIMRSGTALQDAVLDMELAETGEKPEEWSRQTTERHEWMRATPDGAKLIWEDVELAEVKCLTGHPPATPRVADVVQCLHQLMVFAEARHVRLIYFGALRRERFIIPRHQAAMDRVLRAEEAFLEMVEKETPPPVRAADASVLWRGWPFTMDTTAILPPEARGWDEAAEAAKRELDDATERYDHARAQIKAAMGSAMRAAIVGSDVTYTWRADKRGHRALKRKEWGDVT